VKRRKGNTKIIPATKDHNGTIITDTTEKANILNSHYASVFCCDRKTPEIKLANSGEIKIINTSVIRKRLAKIERNKSVGPDGIPGEILKLSGEAMTPFLVRLLEISLNNATNPSDWKIATVVPIYKGGDRSAVSNFRPTSLTSVVCKQLEHFIAGYLRHVWDKNDWLYEGQHGFRPGYSCESQVIKVYQDSLNEGVAIYAIIIDFSKVFDLVPHDRLLTNETGGLGRGFEDSCFGKGIPCRSYTNGKIRRATIQGSQSNLQCAARKLFGPTTVSSVRK